MIEGLEKIFFPKGFQKSNVKQLTNKKLFLNSVKKISAISKNKII